MDEQKTARMWDRVEADHPGESEPIGRLESASGDQALVVRLKDGSGGALYVQDAEGGSGVSELLLSSEEAESLISLLQHLR